MDRQTLTDATNLQDAHVPNYLLEQIAAGTKESPRDAEKTADFLLSRLGKSNLIVKLKALQSISYCVREGSAEFADAIREDAAEISAYLQYTGPPDPVLGDERYRRIRVASQEVMVCLNDRTMHEHSSWAPPADAAPFNQGQGGPSGYGASNDYAQHAHAPSAQSQSVMGTRWGPNPSANDAASSSSALRPAAYSDRPAAPYGAPGGMYGAPQGQYGGGGGYGGPAYGHGNPHMQESTGGYGGEAAPSQQPSGLSSWSQPTAGPGNLPKAAGTGGMWSSSGFQQSAQPTQSYGSAPSYSSRDNRPTVLVGQSVGFSSSAARYGNRGVAGGGGMQSGFSGGFSSGMRSSSGFGVGGNRGGLSSASSRPTFSSSSSGQNRSYIENMNRMLSAPSHSGMGLVSPDAVLGEGAAKTKFGRTVDGLKKIGAEAKEKWDARKMDKSITSSLAQHDALTTTPGSIDRTYFHPSMHQATGGGDKSGDYERGMIDNLCAAGGLARAPPPDLLKRFVELAQSLDVQTIGDILLDKLEDDVWQVRLKALHVVLALVDLPGGSPYVELFEDNAGVFEELRSDSKPTVAAKALQILQVLGLAGADAEPQTAPKHSARPHAVRSPAKSPARQSHPQQEVDFLGLEGLSISVPPPVVRQDVDLLGSPGASPATAPPPPPVVEVSLLDGFDDVEPQQPAAFPQHNVMPTHAPQQPLEDMLAPHPGDHAQTLGDFGKDLFAIATSPRGGAAPSGESVSDSTVAAPPSSEQSAFSFM